MPFTIQASFVIFWFRTCEICCIVLSYIAQLI